MQVESRDAVFKEAGVNRIPRLEAAGLEPQLGILEPIHRSQGTDGAADVPHLLALKRLAEKIETAQALGAGPLRGGFRLGIGGIKIAIPGAGTDATRTDIGHAPLEVLEHPLLLFECLLIVRHGEPLGELLGEGRGE